MTEVEKKMLDELGGDTVAYHNMVAFGNFLCEMIEKDGGEVLEEIEEEKKERDKA